MNRYISSDRTVYLLCPDTDTVTLTNAISRNFDYTVYPNFANKDLELLRRLEIVENSCDLIVYYDAWKLDVEQAAIMAYADAREMDIVHFDDLMDRLARIEEMDCD